MKKIYVCILGLILMGCTSASGKAERGRLSTQYHRVHDKLSEHKGKVGLATGVIGTAVVSKIFSFEIDTYVKPLVKSVCKKVGNFFRRIFRREEKK